MVDIEDIDALWNNTPPQAAQPDPILMAEAQAKVMTAQAKQQEVQIKAQAAQMDNQTKALVTEANVQKLKTDQLRAMTDSQNHAQDRKGKLQLEAMKLQQTAMVHADKLRHDDIHKQMELDSQHHQQRRQQSHDAAERGKDRMFDMLNQPPAAPAGPEQE
jgi:cell division septum initiation protein DivIVA